MTDPYWFWLTFPGGVVIGLAVISPFLIGFWVYSTVKAHRKKKADALRYAMYMDRLRGNRKGK